MHDNWNFLAIRRIKTSAAAVIAFAFLGFGGWAATASISGAVISEGVFKVISNRKAVQHREGGTVKEILVEDGDRVSTGDIVIRLDATRARNSHNLLQSRRNHILASIARLQAELAGETEMVAPDWPGGDRAAFDKTVANQKRLLESRLQMLASSEAMTGEQIAQLNQEVTGLKAKVREQDFQITSIGDEISDLQALFDKGLTPRARLLELKREAAKLRGNRAEATARIGAARRSMAEARQQLAKLRAEFQERANSELNENQRLLNEVSEQLESAAHTLAHSDVRATASGIVVGLSVHTEGGVIAPGDVLMEIVPETVELLVETRIEVASIDNVHRGQEVDVQLVSAKARNLDKLRGRIVYVSADSLYDDKTGRTYFVARAALDGTVPERAREIMQPGLAANVFVRTDARTPLAYLLEPLKDSVSRAWREY